MVKFDYHLMHLCNSSVFEIMRGQKETYFNKICHFNDSTLEVSIEAVVDLIILIPANVLWIYFFPLG